MMLPCPENHSANSASPPLAQNWWYVELIIQHGMLSPKLYSVKGSALLHIADFGCSTHLQQTMLS